MVKVAVYRFELFDKTTRSWLLQTYRATWDHIESLGGAPYLGSEIFVSDSHVTNGVYEPD